MTRSQPLLAQLCHALAGDWGDTFSLVDESERDAATEPCGKENGEAISLVAKSLTSTSASSSPDLNPDLDLDDRALTSRRHRRSRHRLRVRMTMRSDSGESGELSAMASLGATAAFLEAAARVLSGSFSGTASASASASASAEACAFGWELSRLLEEYRECVLELESMAAEEEEEEGEDGAAKGNGDGESPASSSSSLPLPVPRIRLHLGEWPAILEEVAALAELALESAEEEEEEEEKEGLEKKPSPSSRSVPPAAALARAAAASARCGAPHVEAAARRFSAAIERAQLLALAAWCARGERPRGGRFWAAPSKGGEGEEGLEGDPFSSFELFPAALPPFLTSEAARDALFVGCAARAFAQRRKRREAGNEGDGNDDDEQTRSSLLSLLSSPEDELPTTTIRPTAVASALAAARERAERRLFLRCCLSPSPSSSESSSSSSSSSSSLFRALEALRRVALLGDSALWGTALRSGYLCAAALEKEGGGGNLSSALEAAADDAGGAAAAAALEALFSPEAPLRLSLFLDPPTSERGGKKGSGKKEAPLWSRLTVRKEGAAAWPLGLLPLFSTPPRSPSSPSGDESENGSDGDEDDPWQTVRSLFSTLLALERASLSLEEAYLLLKIAAREKKGKTFSSSAAGNENENALLSLWHAHRDASFAVRGVLSHLREDVLSPADKELDSTLRDCCSAATAATTTNGPWSAAAAALGRWRSRVASCSVISSSSSSGPVVEALKRLCGACHAVKRAMELNSLLLDDDGNEDGNARSLASASAASLLGAAAAAGESARALAAAAVVEATEASHDDDFFAAAHRAMLLGRVSFG